MATQGRAWPPTIFVAKLARNGTTEWAVGFWWQRSAGASVAAHADGSVIVTKYFSGTASFGPHHTLKSTGIWDIFVAKRRLARASPTEWAVGFGGCADG